MPGLSLRRRARPESDYPPEVEVTKKLVKKLTEMGYVAVHFPNSPYFIKGFPDLFVLSPGPRVSAWELKTPDGALTPHQIVFNARLQQRVGLTVRVLTVPDTGRSGISLAAEILAALIKEELTR